MTELKKWITTALLTLLLLPAMAQQKADTTYTFRFVPQKDMFYVPWNGNDMELARLLECIESNKADILDGKLPLYVDGYCNSLNGEKENLAIAKIRSNRVKSELITRAGIKEESFITRNHPAEGDFVTVRLTVPAEETTVSDVEAEAQRKAEAERLATEKRAEQERLPKSSARRKKPDLPLKRQKLRKPLNKTHLPTRRRKPKSQMIIISPCVPTCCAGLPDTRFRHPDCLLPCQRDCQRLGRSHRRRGGTELQGPHAVWRYHHRLLLGRQRSGTRHR